MKNLIYSFTVCVILTSVGCKMDEGLKVNEEGPFRSIRVGEKENANFFSPGDTIFATGGISIPINWDRIEYDLDGKGKADISFTAVGGGGDDAWGVSCFVMPLSNNEIILTECYNSKEQIIQAPLSLTLGSTINDSMVFTDYPDVGDGFTLGFVNYDSKMNCWGNDVYHYIGVRIPNKNDTTYAWLEVAIKITNNSASTMIKSIASRR